MRRLPWIAAIVLLLSTACPAKEPQDTEAAGERPAAQAPARQEQAAAQAEAPSGEPIRIEVWHDTVCPWCKVALHNLDTVVSGWEGRPVEVIYRPYLLSPDMPPEGRSLEEQFGPNAEQVKASQTRVTAIGAQFGVRFDFDAIERIPSTVASHALIDWAPQEKKAELIAATQRAHFEEGRNIGDPQVLAEIAASVGLDAAAARAAVTDEARLQRVREEAAAARKAGVNSVPFIDVEGRKLRGAQAPDVIRHAIATAAAD